MAWVVHHILAGRNSMYIFSWLVFQIIPTWFVSRTRLEVGNVVNDFINGDFSRTLLSILMIFVYAVLGPVISIIANFSREMIAQNMERDVRREFFHALLDKSQAFHDSQKVGDIMARSTEDVRSLNLLINPALSVLMEAALILLIPIVVIAFNYPPSLLILPLGYITYFIISIYFYYQKLSPIAKAQQRLYGNLNQHVLEKIAGMIVVKSSAREKEATGHYDDIADEYRALNVKMGKLQAKSKSVYLVLLFSTSCLVHAILLYYNGRLTVGDIVAYYSIVLTYQQAAHFSVWAFTAVSKASAGADRLLDLMNKEAFIPRTTTHARREISGDIEFKNVSFTYPGETRPALIDVSFKLNRNETLAIVGMTGSGKTTLIKLISRLHDVDAGIITIDGVDITRYDLDALRQHISVIEQDIFLFPDTIARNISLGRDYPLESIKHAAIKAQAHDFIQQLPMGYDTEIGDKGIQLSGGERQRIAIARAILSDPRILVLDDSTSAIDAVTEEKIQRAIANVQKHRTTILITHRLSQVRWADAIVMLQEGRVTAAGTHDELMARSRVYRNIFMSRFEDELDDMDGLDHGDGRVGDTTQDREPGDA